MKPQPASTPQPGDPLQRLSTLETENARLRAEVDELRHLLDYNPQVPWTADPDGRITGFTQRWLDLTGLTRESALGDGWLQVPHPDDLPQMVAAWQHSVRTGAPYDIEHRIRLADATYRWMRSRAQARHDTEGRIVRWYGTTEDIDDRKQAEDAQRRQAAELGQERDRFVEVFAQAPAFIAVLRGPDHVFERVNPAYYQLVGHRDLEGKPLLEALPELRGQGFDELLTRVLATGEPYSGTGIAVQLQRKPDAAPEQRHVDFVYAPLNETDGRRSGVVALGCDVTERVRAERELAAERARLQAVLDHAPIGITLAEAPSGALVMGNRRMDEIFRRPLIASPDIESYREWGVWREDGTRLEPHEYPLAQALTAGVAASGCFRCERGDGTTAWMQCNAAPVRDEAGQLTGAVITIQDVDAERRAAEALRRSEAEFRQIADAQPQLVWVTRPDGYHEWYNRRWYEYIGSTWEQSSGEHWASFFHPEDIGDAQRRWAHSLATGEPYEVEYRCRRHDGAWRWFLGRAAPLRDEQGQITRWFGTCTDIHDQKQAAGELQRSQEQLRLALEAGKLGIWELDWACGAVHWDGSTAEIYGLAAADLATYEATMAQVIPADERIRIEASLAGACDPAGSGRYDIEHRIIRPDGTIRWVSARGQAQFQGEGQERRATLLSGTVQDVTERRVLEESLDAERRLLQSIMEQLPVGVMVTDQAGAVTLMNDALMSIWRGRQPLDGLDGYRQYEAWDAATGQPIEPVDWPVARALATGLPQGPDEYRIRRFDGTEGYLNAVAVPRRDANGTVVGGIAVGHDITDRRKAENELRRSNEDLERFAFMASHDLQEPLRMVTSYTQLLARRYRSQLDASADEYLGFVQQGTERMGRLIRDLLLYARSSTGEELERGPVDANVALQLALVGLQTRIEESQASLSWDRLPVVLAVEGLLSQVLQNLISNALKYVRPGVVPEVHIGALRQGADWVFSVRDNGQGIAPQHQERIFGLFTRLHGREVSGTGIGLATVKRIVERHGGRVWVESEPGVGSTFFFTLPQVAEENEGR